RIDGESEWWLAELWSTPVGRRWLLKAGLGSAAAAVAARGWGAPAQARQPVVGAASAVRLQFALGAARGVSDLVLVANGKRLPLQAHTAASRRTLRARGGLWAKMDLGALTHFVEGVSLPADQAIVVSAVGFRGRREVIVAQLWHVPEEATLALAKMAHRLQGSLRSVLGTDHRLAALGIRAAQLRSPQEAAQLATIVGSDTTATAIVMHHPTVSTKDTNTAAITTTLLNGTPEVDALGAYIPKMQRRGEDPLIYVQATERDGSPSQITVGGLTRPLKTIRLNQDDQQFVESTKSALIAGVRAVRTEPKLGAVIDKPVDEQPPDIQRRTWMQPIGVTPQVEPASSARAKGAGLQINIKNPAFMYLGTTTTINGDLHDNTVPLRIHNDFVRWISVYVQYLGNDGKNLSLNSSAKFPDTQYAKFLGILPQVFTIIGVPAFTTNFIDVDLTFPAEAHSARLLYCGLGADAVGAGWRQYFPEDAYANRIAPTGEVTVPALITGFLSIGLTAFALASALDIARAWAAIRAELEKTGQEFGAVLSGVFSLVAEDLAAGTFALTTSEAFAALVATGGATYEQIQSEGLHNLWNLLLSLATVIPKVLFNPKVVFDLAEAILSVEAADKIIEAIPAIGQVIATLAAVGDALTLAEALSETVACPWVIENEVTLTYDASVTVSHDPCAASFPPAAKSWRLEAKVDGALVLDPVTGAINSGGTGQSTPVHVTATAPFGGNQIQWSMVLLDASGSQVAAGVSAPYV
ncbi:MAG: hypothetical protein JOZ98_00005, partial [Solirubrobacterales bacterium]|nr:hypothetical protein [Solirubrobacterales bacterium]